jgi:hypothetical protein
LETSSFSTLFLFSQERQFNLSQQTDKEKHPSEYLLNEKPMMYIAAPWKAFYSIS